MAEKVKIFSVAGRQEENEKKGEEEERRVKEAVRGSYRTRRFTLDYTEQLRA